MKVIDQSYEIMTPIDGKKEIELIERIGRTCYKSEDKITEDSADKFIRMLRDRGHEAMLEHGHITVKFITDRGVTHEIVRHRMASYAQESTRYCNYAKDKFGNEITVIKPAWGGDYGAWEDGGEDNSVFDHWYRSCLMAEAEYFHLLYKGWTPQEARAVLPNSLKAELVMTANYREWRHFFKLRTSKAAHPQLRALAIPLLEELKAKLPALFDDIEVE